tara:strand:+ start:955 stop:1503 length:549 start_codon:yes stop_codon:yes gene_type:complete
MVSTINVDQIGHGTSGASAITISSDGKVTMPNTIEIDLWRLGTDFESNARITGWVRPTYTGHGYAGTGMTESSGIFTFPRTGLYKVTGQFRISLDSLETSAGCSIRLSTDSGVNFTEIAGGFENRNNNAHAGTHALVNVTNISTFRLDVLAISLDTDAGNKIGGHPTRSDTSILFERITDSQ